MMRSLFSGVSGLKNHQTRMDVIGNNISKLLMSVIPNHLLNNGVNNVAKNNTIISPTLLESKN